jgi:hypothetical protein
MATGLATIQAKDKELARLSMRIREAEAVLEGVCGLARRAGEIGVSMVRQTGPFTSRPARYAALHGVTPATTGRLNHTVRSLHQTTFEHLGYAVVRAYREAGVSRRAIRSAMEAVLGTPLPALSNQVLSNRVAVNTALWGALKLARGLESSNHISLREMLDLCTRFNQWVLATPQLDESFLLVQELDLRIALRGPRLGMDIPAARGLTGPVVWRGQDVIENHFLRQDAVVPPAICK